MGYWWLVAVMLAIITVLIQWQEELSTNRVKETMLYVCKNIFLEALCVCLGYLSGFDILKSCSSSIRGGLFCILAVSPSSIK